MARVTKGGGEIRQIARDQVRSEALERCLAAILYPECLAPVTFTDYTFVVSNV